MLVFGRFEADRWARLGGIVVAPQILLQSRGNSGFAVDDSRQIAFVDTDISGHRISCNAQLIEELGPG